MNPACIYCICIFVFVLPGYVFVFVSLAFIIVFVLPGCVFVFVSLAFISILLFCIILAARYICVFSSVFIAYIFLYGKSIPI